jgi:hypothetical protein
MTHYRKLLTVATLALALLGAARAAEITGKWHAEFDTQIGLQKYTYEFKADGGKLTGHAVYERENGKGEVDLKDVKLNGDDVSFTEPLKFDDQEISITYTGKVAGDELKLTRQVGDFATEEVVAKRVIEPAAAPAARN